MNFFDDVIKDIGKDTAKLSKDLEESHTFLDTGSYIFNALCSTSIFGGVSDNKITAIAGAEATGKTFFALSICNNFMKQNPKGGVIYFDTEGAITKELLENRGMDPTGKQFLSIDCLTVEDFRTVAYKILDKYNSQEEEKRQPMLIVLDSLGNLSTEKETKDIADGKSVRDMTKAQIVKGTFRVLTQKLSQAKVPLIVLNHTYDVIGSYMPTKEMGGGSGLKYAATTIIYLSKSQEKEGTERVGNIIKAKVIKSRISKESEQISTRLYYDKRGLDKYYGLLELAEKGGIWKKVSTRYEVDGKKIYASEIYKNPEKYFTQEILEKIDTVAKQTFSYGNGESTTNDSE